MTATARFNHPITVLFDEASYKRLEELQRNGLLPKAQVIRAAVDNMHAMTILQQPRCANGHACHCPHTHTFGPRP